MDFLLHALQYAASGWSIFPVAPGDKVPAIKGGHGVKDATIRQDVIHRWARDFPYGNIGLACGEPSGGVVVIDIDPRHGGDNSIAALAMKGRCFPDGPRSKTGNGGQHLFFRFSGKLMNSKGKLGDGIDIRSTGGYVVAPPSWLKPSSDGNGGQYQWIAKPKLLGGSRDLPRLPIWVSELLKPRDPKPYVPSKTFQEGADRLRHLADYLASAQKGHRNNVAYWATKRAAEMVADGKVSPAMVAQRMRVAGQMAGLSADEIDKTIASALASLRTTQS